uniref:tRNA(Ile)-lysidine/2-thiocytidine synthase N-terminal domain-containing protein n=1 Tax=Romanomermis culicivorax TaxID=13658 RepID=A0A915I2A9_ROMCU
MVICLNCRSEKAAVRRPKTGDAVCRSCFLNLFETEVHRTIIAYNLFEPGETVAIGVSGGKDSSVVLHVLDLLNQRYQYGVNLVMVAIDEGIVGYRDHSLEAVHDQQRKYKLPLKILSYDELFGWTMDKVVALTGKKGNCTYCGVFRRQSLEKGAVVMGASKLVTGHNADDAAETVSVKLVIL